MSDGYTVCSLFAGICVLVYLYMYIYVSFLKTLMCLFPPHCAGKVMQPHGVMCVCVCVWVSVLEVQFVSTIEHIGLSLSV